MARSHHVTAIAGSPLKNFDFYTRDLGLHLVRKTVNFDVAASSLDFLRRSGIESSVPTEPVRESARVSSASGGDVVEKIHPRTGHEINDHVDHARRIQSLLVAAS